MAISRIGVQPFVRSMAAFLYEYMKIVLEDTSEQLHSGKLSLVGNKDHHNLRKLLPRN